MGKIILWLLIIAAVLFVTWIAIGIFTGPDDGPNIPGTDEAAYSLYAEKTGLLIFTDQYAYEDMPVGKRVFNLQQGYWSMGKKDFKFNPSDIMLKEEVWGEITVRRRQ